MTTQPGFIAIARGSLDHPIVGARKPYSDYEAWHWMIFEAAYTPRRVSVSNGRARETLELQRGQLTHSVRYMAAAWGWSVKRVRTFLYRLKTDAQIDTQTDTLQTVITLCNYERYQNPEMPKGTQTTTQRARKGHKEEQGNKETKDNTDDEPYFFESGVIRLSRKDFEKWQDAFQHLDLKAELLALTQWAAQQGNQWFFAVSGALAKRNREQKAKAAQQANGGFRHGPNDPNAGII